MDRTRLEELENWATLMIEMDTMRRRCCTAIKDANACRRCPFWQQDDCLEVVSLTNNVYYRPKDVAKMLAVGESIYNLMRLGVYKTDEDDF